MKMAEKFRRPVIVIVDTPAAYPASSRRSAASPRRSPTTSARWPSSTSPIIVAICGEGGSGGALGLAIGDRILIQEFAIYSVIPPEGCAAILWRDSARKVEASEALKLTAPDMLRLGIVDAIVPEPVGGAHNDPESAAGLLDRAIVGALESVRPLTSEQRTDSRYQKFRQMGRAGSDFVDLASQAAG